MKSSRRRNRQPEYLLQGFLRPTQTTCLAPQSNRKCKMQTTTINKIPYSKTINPVRYICFSLSRANTATNIDRSPTFIPIPPIVRTQLFGKKIFQNLKTWWAVKWKNNNEVMSPNNAVIRAPTTNRGGDPLLLST